MRGASPALRTLVRDPIALSVTVLWAGMAVLYFVPGVPASFLEQLGERYSTLPLWPFAIAACLAGASAHETVDDRRFWRLQAFSFAALLLIEAPWAFARADDTPAWNVVAEWCYFAYYAGQLMSAAETRTGRIRVVAISAFVAAGLSVLAVRSGGVYDTGRPSYIAYLIFDAAIAARFSQLRERTSGTRALVFSGLAATSLIIWVTDALDWLAYEGRLGLVGGMKTDILWMLPPLFYALVARFGRQRLDPAS